MIRGFRLSLQLFPVAEKEIRLVLVSVVVGSWYRGRVKLVPPHKTRPVNAQNSYENLVKYVCLGADMFSNAAPGTCSSHGAGSRKSLPPGNDG